MINSNKDKMLTSYLAVVGQFHLKNRLQKAMKFLLNDLKMQNWNHLIGLENSSQPSQNMKRKRFIRLEQNGLYQCKYTAS
jgi:hypothetical protein